MRRTLTRVLVAAGAVLALGAGPALMASASAQASVARPASNLPWCDSDSYTHCLVYAGAGNYDELAVVPGQDYSVYYTRGTSGWAGYTTYIYENPANGYCLGSLGPGTNGILESACHDGLDQQFFMNPDGFWQNAGASAGTGEAYIVDADYSLDIAEIAAQTGSSPNSHEQWIR